MRLLVLGPAFGLPSIDVECLATIALLHLRGINDWELVPSSHTKPDTLPILIDGETHITRFHNILHHLKSSLPANLHLTSADSTALSSFIESTARPLLDFSLYVSPSNYHDVTRPAFTKILPLHANYVLPPAIRNAARIRTQHLGITTTDVDDTQHDDMSGRPDTLRTEQGIDPETQKRASLLLPKRETLRGLLRRPENTAIFKLHALTADFCEPLAEILGEKSYLQGEDISAVDLLAYAYLSLMLYPAVPQDWLATTLRRKFGTLVKYVARMRAELGIDADVEGVMAFVRGDQGPPLVAGGSKLPWSAPHGQSISSTISIIGRGLLSSFPSIHAAVFPARLVHTKSHPNDLTSRYMTTWLATVSLVMGASLYTALRTGLLIWPHGQQVQIFRRAQVLAPQFRGLGDALSLLSPPHFQAGTGR